MGEEDGGRTQMNSFESWIALAGISHIVLYIEEQFAKSLADPDNSSVQSCLCVCARVC